MKVAIINNFDSFVYNLYHYVKHFTSEVDVIRIDKVVMDALDEYDAMVLSPGPGLPPDMPNLIEIVKRYAATKKILGVCLGHQAIAMAFGGSLMNLNLVLHGLSMPSHLVQNQENIFMGLPIKLACARYHSWVVDPDSIDDQLQPTAYDEDGHLMGIRHQKYDVHGVQFHPESIMTVGGLQMIENWINL